MALYIAKDKILVIATHEELETGCKLNRVGGHLTVPLSHTTGHTCSVPRRFPLTFNILYRSVRLTSP